MSKRGLKMAEPPARRPAAVMPQEESKAELADPAAAAPARSRPKTDAQPSSSSGPAFAQVREDETVQFNKRLPRGVADRYEMLAIKTRKKVPQLLAEGLELLEERHGKS